MNDYLRDDKKEWWFHIPVKLGDYGVSTHGRIYSYKHDRFIKPSISSVGYPRASLCKNGKIREVLIHRLVLEVFVGPCPKGKECCHKDGNRKNNHLSNLRWDTRKNNFKDRYNYGTEPTGANNPNAKLTKKNVITILKILKQGGKSYVEIGRKFGVTGEMISYIKRNLNWKHIPRTEGILS